MGIYESVFQEEQAMSDCFYPLDARKYYNDLKEAQHDLFGAFMGLYKAMFEKETSLPTKTKEHIALAEAHITQCPIVRIAC
jgi:hypothetical protein